MSNQGCSAEPASLRQSDIAELAGGIDVLRQRIVAMVADGEETRHLSERLFDMLRALRELKAAGR